MFAHINHGFWMRQVRQTAVCYEEGVGVPASFNEARNYYEQAVRGGVMSAFTALGYAEIVNGDLDDALDAFHASLESGNPDAAEGVALLSTLQISSQAAPSPMEQNIKHASAELLKMEIDQYANLSMKLYDVIMKSNSEALSTGDRECDAMVGQIAPKIVELDGRQRRTPAVFAQRTTKCRAPRAVSRISRYIEPAEYYQ